MFAANWKYLVGIERLLLSPIVFILFSINGIKVQNGWKIFGLPIILKHNKSQINFGKQLQLRSTIISNPLGVNHKVIICTWRPDSEILIGENFGMTGGSIIASKSVKIGNNVNVGANTTIVDTDFHPLKSEERGENPNAGNSSSIVIEDNVFIGMNCLILKGVTIGKGSVIGAGSVVTKSIPAGVIAAGNPARVIRKISLEEK